MAEKVDISAYDRRIQVLNEMTSRLEFGRSMGMQYGGKRNMFKILGYPNRIRYQDYLNKYARLDIAKAVIDRPVGATWRGILELEESGTGETTELEKAWKKLYETLKLKDVFSRVDKLASLGRYAIILLGFDDTANNATYAQPVDVNANLKFIRAYSEANAEVKSYEGDEFNERFGQPIIYQITTHNLLNGSSQTLDVHYTRILHIVGDPLDSDLEGAPALEAIYNRLLDLEKIVGGDGEMFWRGARPGFSGKVEKDATTGTKTEDDLKEQIDNYENDLVRFIINEGLDLKALEQQLADPKSHVDVQLQMICAVKGIPKRILTGSERGELSSAQDSQEWRAYIQERREEYAEIRIVKPFIERMMEYEILPQPETGEFTIKWPNVYDLNPKEKSEMGKNRAIAIKEFTTNSLAMALFPKEAVLEYLLGLEPEQIELIKKEMAKGLGDEEKSMRDVMEFVQEVTTPPQAEKPAATPAKKPAAK